MRVLSFSIAGLFLAASVSAAPLTISNVTGLWQNPDATVATAATVDIDNQAGSLADTINWGVGYPNPLTNPKSGYIFDPLDGDVSPPLNSVFALGDFTHENFPITNFGFFGVEYALSFDTNGIPVNLGNVFLFEHNETPNVGPCPVGVPPCADIVTISQLTFNQLIDVGGDLYFFSLLGFSTDGGTTFDSVFVSEEGAANSAVLYAQITEQPISQVPEPASLGLMGAGLAFIAHQIRRRKSN